MALVNVRGLTTRKTFVLAATASDSGGGGGVHDVTGEPDLIAKLIHAPEPLTGTYGTRVTAVAEMDLRDPRLVRLVEPLVSVTDPNTVVGVLLKRVAGHTLYSVTNPDEQRLLNITLTTADRVRLAGEVARAFDTLHRHQLVLGDAHHRNVMIACAPDGTLQQAVIIEPDTWCFEYRINGRQTYFTSMAVQEFLPPEFLNVDLLQTKLTYESDRYALVLLACLSLFSCLPSAFAGSSLTIEQRCRQGYEWITPNLPAGARAPDRLPIAWAAVPTEIRELLRKGLGPPGGRPTASELGAALEKWRRAIEPAATARRFLSVLAGLARARTIAALWQQHVAAFFAKYRRGDTAAAAARNTPPRDVLKPFAVGLIGLALVAWTIGAPPLVDETPPAPANEPPVSRESLKQRPDGPAPQGDWKILLKD